MKLKTGRTQRRTSAKPPSSVHGKVKQVEKCEWDQVKTCGIHKRSAGNEGTCIDKKRGEVWKVPKAPLPLRLEDKDGLQMSGGAA